MTPNAAPIIFFSIAIALWVFIVTKCVCAYVGGFVDEWYKLRQSRVCQ